MIGVKPKERPESQDPGPMKSKSSASKSCGSMLLGPISAGYQSTFAGIFFSFSLFLPVLKFV